MSMFFCLRFFFFFFQQKNVVLEFLVSKSTDCALLLDGFLRFLIVESLVFLKHF